MGVNRQWQGAVFKIPARRERDGWMVTILDSTTAASCPVCHALEPHICKRNIGLQCIHLIVFCTHPVLFVHGKPPAFLLCEEPFEEGLWVCRHRSLFGFVPLKRLILDVVGIYTPLPGVPQSEMRPAAHNEQDMVAAHKESKRCWQHTTRARYGGSTQ